MKNGTPVFNRRNLRAFVASLIAYLMLAGQLAPLALASTGPVTPLNVKPVRVSETRTDTDSGAGQPAKLAAPVPLAAPAFVPSITATKVDAYAGAPGPAVPGQTITYTVTINNAMGAMDATGVMFNDTVDPNTTLVPGSVMTTPLARNDSFNVLGNVRIQVPDGASDLLANDNDPDGGSLTITTLAGDSTAPFDGTSTRGGNVTATTGDGSFQYNPPVGYEGADSFTYTVTDSSGNTDTATVNITIAGMIWFINNSATACTTISTAAGCGRLTNPLSTLQAFEAANGNNTTMNGGDVIDPEAGDHIFIFTGGGNYTGPLTLEANQRVVGQGASDTLANITGVTVPMFSDTLPATGGTRPTITTVGIAHGIVLATANTIRGLTVGITGGTKLIGNNFGTLTVGNNTTPDVQLSDFGPAINLTNGTFAATSGFVSVASTGAPAQGIALSQVAGTVSLGSTTVSGSTTQGILVTQSTANINFGNTSIGNMMANSGGTDAVSLQNNSMGTRTFGTLTIMNNSMVGFLHSVGGGTTTVTGQTTITNPGGAGIDIQSSTTAVSFSNTTVNMSGGTGVELGGAGVANTGAVSFADLDISPDMNVRAFHAVDNTGMITTTSGTIMNTGSATTFEIDGPAGRTPLAMALTSISSDGGANGTILMDVSGSFSSGTTNLQNNGGIGLLVSNSTAAFNFGNTTVNSSAGDAVDISGQTGNVTFGALNLSPDANLRGLDVATTSGTVTSTSGTITTTDAVAVNVVGATPLSLVLTSVSANNDGTANSCVSLTNVTGTTNMQAGACTGGTASAFLVSGGTANITYAGTITQNTGGQRAVDVQNKTGGTNTFSGAITASTTTANAIHLATNTGATNTFTGGMNLTTTSGTAFNATGGGTVNTTGTNTVTTTTGAAVNITDTTIGGSNVAFQSINKNGNNTAIVLDDTGAGTFTVTGTGTTAGTGGTIENITNADAITLNNTDGLVTFRNMIIEDIGSTAGGFNTISGHDAIHGQMVDGGLNIERTTIQRISDNAINGSTFAAGTSTTWNGLSITSNSLIQHTNRFHVAGVGDENNESMVRVLGIIGTVNITDSQFLDGAEMLDLFPSSSSGGTMTMTVTNNNFHRAYKEFTSGTTASVGGHCVDVTVRGNANAIVNIGHRTNNALDNDFLNCGLGSIRVANDQAIDGFAAATGNIDVLIGQNEFTVNDHSSGITGDFDFPQGGVLMQSRGTNTATWDVVLDSNYFDEIANASGGVGQFTLDMDGGQWNVIAEENTFDTPGNAPWYVRADNAGNVGTMNSNILFQNNNYIQGFFSCPDPSCDDGVPPPGYTAPGLRSLVDVQNGANINFTLSSDELVHHDTGFDPGQTVEVRKLNVPVGGNNGTVCANFVNNDAPDGYSVENFTTVGAFNIQQGASNSGGPCTNCTDAQIADVFADNGNTGGMNNPATFPPFVNVFNTGDPGAGPINIVSTPCTQPSIPFAPETVTEQKFETNAPAEALSADVAAPLTEPLDDLLRMVLPPIDDESSDAIMKLKIARRAARRSTDDESTKRLAPTSMLNATPKTSGDITPADDGGAVDAPDSVAPKHEPTAQSEQPNVAQVVPVASAPSASLLPSLEARAAEFIPANRTERAHTNPLGLRPTAKRDSGAAFSHTATASAAPLNLAPVSAAPLPQRGGSGSGGGTSVAPPAPRPRSAPPVPNGVGGGTVSVNIGTLQPGDSVTITFQVTINNPFMGGSQVSNQGTVSGSNFSNVLTDDPAVGGAADPTVTPVVANPDVSVRDATEPEPSSGSSNMVFTVALSAPAGASGASVNFTTMDEAPGPGKAVAGQDYTATNGTVSFAMGQQVKTINVPILSDMTAGEPDETFLVNLSSPMNANIVDGQATGTITAQNPPGTTLISELRHFGPGMGNDPNDEFVEIYNNTDSMVTVAASDASAGWGLYKMGADCNATPVLIGVIPNGTVIPARGHFLFTGSAYSLANYGGTGAAAGNLTLSAEIEANSNVAIFSTSDIAAISTVNRLDAVGFGLNTGGVCDLLREGTTQPALTMNQTLLGQHSYFRKLCDFVSGVGCSTPGQPKDTHSNSADFQFADTNGVNTGAGQQLGAPGPENLASPRRVPDANFPLGLLDNTKPAAAVPNRFRDQSGNGNDPSTSTFGTLSIRRRVINNTGGTVTRLRFRIVELTTFPSPPGTADLRAITSMAVMVSPVGDAGTCAPNPTPCTVTVQGTTLEQPPAQPNGGGLNATFSATLPGGGLPAGQSLNLQFLLGVQQPGTFRFLLIVEALP